MNKLTEKQEIEHFWAVWRLSTNMKPMIVSYWGDGRYFTFSDSTAYTEEHILILKPVEPF